MKGLGGRRVRLGNGIAYHADRHVRQLVRVFLSGVSSGWEAFQTFALDRASIEIAVDFAAAIECLTGWFAAMSAGQIIGGFPGWTIFAGLVFQARGLGLGADSEFVAAVQVGFDNADRDGCAFALVVPAIDHEQLTSSRPPCTGCP